MSREHVFILQHVHELEDGEDVKLIGVYSSEARAREAIERLSTRPGFRDCPQGFHVSKYAIDRDHWLDGYVTIVSVEVPLVDTDETITVHAELLASGAFRLVADPRPSESWRFKPHDTVRCELRRQADGNERYVAVELVTE